MRLQDVRTTVDFLFANIRWLGAGVLLTFLSSFGQTFFISIFAGEIQAAFGLSHGSWGTIYAIGTTSAAVAMIWAGVLADRIRVRTLGAVVLVGLAAACLLMAGNIWAWALPVVIFCLRFAGQSMASHIAMVAMARWFVATRGRALAVATLGFSLGEMALPFGFVLLLEILDWRLLWVAAALVVLLAVPLLFALLRTERVPGSEPEQDRRAGIEGRHWQRAEALRSRVFWLIVPAIMGHSAFGTAVFFHQVHYAEVVGVAHLGFVGLFPVYTLVSIFSMLVSGIALDRYGTVRLIPFYQLPLILAFLCFGFADSLPAVAMGFVLFGMASGAAATLVNAYWAEVFGTAHIGGIKALGTAAMVLGSAIGPAMTGLMIDIGFGIDWQYVCISGFFVLSTVGLFGASRYALARLV